MTDLLKNIGRKKKQLILILLTEMVEIEHRSKHDNHRQKCNVKAIATQLCKNSNLALDFHMILSFFLYNF